MSVRLTKAQIKLLREYEQTSDTRYMQGLPGASKLDELGLLDWHGNQYGSHFYSITEAGHIALAASPDKGEVG